MSSFILVVFLCNDLKISAVFKRQALWGDLNTCPSFLHKFLRQQRMFSFSIFIHLSTYSLTVHPLSQQLFTEQLLCAEPGAVRIQSPWDAVPVPLYLFVSASAVLLFHLLLFFSPYIFEANSGIRSLSFCIWQRIWLFSQML